MCLFTELFEFFFAWQRGPFLMGQWRRFHRSINLQTNPFTERMLVAVMQSYWYNARSGLSGLCSSPMGFKKNTCRTRFYLDSMRFCMAHTFRKDGNSLTVCNKFCERVDKGRIRFLSFFIRTNIVLGTLNGLNIDPFHNSR